MHTHLCYVTCPLSPAQALACLITQPERLSTFYSTKKNVFLDSFAVKANVSSSLWSVFKKEGEKVS